MSLRLKSSVKPSLTFLTFYVNNKIFQCNVLPFFLKYKICSSTEKNHFHEIFCEIIEKLTKISDLIWRKFGIDLVCFYWSNFASFFVLFCKANWRKILQFFTFAFHFTNCLLVLWRRQSLHLWVNRRRMSEYDFVAGGSLKLKGVSDGGIKK